MDDIKITTQKNVNLKPRGWRSKYRDIYAEIEEKIDEAEWLVIDNIETIRQAQAVVNGIKTLFPGIEVSLRKYTVKGFLRPRIFVKGSVLPAPDPRLLKAIEEIDTFSNSDDWDTYVTSQWWKEARAILYKHIPEAKR